MNDNFTKIERVNPTPEERVEERTEALRQVEAAVGGDFSPAGEAGAPESAGIFNEFDFMKRNMQDQELGRDVIASYVVSAAGSLTSLRKSLAAGDEGGVLHLAHSLKGASATISAPAMYRLAAELEKMGRNGELDCAGSLVRQLEDEFEHLKVVLAERGWYRRHPAPEM